MTGGVVLRAEGIKKTYRGRAVVNGVNLDVSRGEIVGLLGPNGAGKTTTFYMIVGLVRPDSGRIELSGRKITRLPVYKRAHLGLGYLSQDPSVFRKLTVEQNIMAILETLPMSLKDRRHKLDAMLEELGLANVRKQRAYTLSGGERRKLEITRALVTQPDVLMLDEPFSGVDPLAVQDIQGILRELRSRGLGIIITDHNVRETLSVVDRAYLIYEGKVLREGKSSFLINDEMSRELYLGNQFSM